MADGSQIQWTDATWNPVTSNGRLRSESTRRKFVKGAIPVVLHPDRLTVPLHWRRPRRIFVNSLSDLFHEDVPFEFIDRVFAVMALTPQHTYQVLTKRPERMREYVDGYPHYRDKWAAERVQKVMRDMLPWEKGTPGSLGLPQKTYHWPGWPLPNVWLGTSVELQHWADIRIPELLATPAAVRFLSCEPLLGPLDLRPWLTRVPTSGDGWRLTGGTALAIADIVLDWVIVGGESGPGARPFDLGWARSLVAQCRTAGVAVFVKQLGAKPCIGEVETGARTNVFAPDFVHLKDRKGGDWDEWPEDLRVREMPR